MCRIIVGKHSKRPTGPDPKEITELNGIAAGMAETKASLRLGV